MPEQQPLFEDCPVYPETAPPVGSEWASIYDWTCTLYHYDGTSLVDYLYDMLDLGGGHLSRRFIHHMLWCIKVFDRKQQNYGPENIAKLGESGIMSRVSDDKFSRLKTLNQNPDGVLEGEPALDAWHDACVYGALGAMVHVGDWPSCEELGINSKSLEQVCHEAIEMAARGDGTTADDALRYIEENLPK